MKTWQSLNKPPVVVALFQIKYNSVNMKLSNFLKFDSQLRYNLPLRSDNVQVGIDLGESSIPLGVSKVSATSDVKINSYVYLSNDQKVRLEISDNTISYIDERPYQGWINFKESLLKTLMVLSEILNNLEITRTSIRFINLFTFENFDNPAEYFKTLISSSEDNELPFPLRQYGFRLLMNIPDSDIYAIVNQNVENVRVNSYIYTFDIDVLNTQHFIFEKEALAVNMDKLREIKNEIFFNNITQKTIDLCN